jgi:hypothetical protein
MSNPEKTLGNIVATQEGESELVSPEVQAELNEEEQEFRSIRRDLPGVKGVQCRGYRSDRCWEDTVKERVLSHSQRVSTDCANGRL